MTEQDRIATPNESAPTSAAEVKPAKTAKSAKQRLAMTGKVGAKKNSSLTDDQKRLARNAALREWRKKNADRVKAYMTEWRAKREGKQPERAEGRDRKERGSVQPAAGAVLTQKRPATAAKSAPSKKLKKGGKA